MSPKTKILLYLFLVSWCTISTFADERFDRFYEGKIGVIRDAATALARVMAPSALCHASQKCNQGSCIPNGCAHDSFGRNYQCSSLIVSEGQESICPNSCNPDKRLLNLDTAFLSAPPDTLQYETHSGVQNFKVKDPKLLRDVCALKSIRSALQEAFEKHNLSSWLYASTSSGLQMTYPGAARRREKKSLEQCGFVPMRRPWYVAASSGRKDVVFIFDTTSLTTAEKVLSRSLLAAIDALDRDDYVSVIAMAKEVHVLGNSRVLQRAKAEFKEQLKRDIGRLQPSSGAPATRSALETAFDILQMSSEQQRSSFCSKIIVLLIGKAPGCYTRCQSASTPCTCTSDIVDAVKQKQESLRENVSIVTFTEGKNNDAERIARSLVCESSAPGVWRQVPSTESPESSLSAYTDIASLTQTSKEYTSEVVDDFSGMGEVFTIAQPVYVADFRLAGVVGHDISIAEVSEAVGGREMALSAIANRIQTENRQCVARSPDSCERQRLRAQYGDICADTLVRDDKNWKCFRAGDSFFFRIETALTWVEAQSRCRSYGNGSDLAIVDSPGKNEIVAGISSLDGSWIGLRARRGSDVQWVNGSPSAVKGLGFSVSNGDIELEIEKLHLRELVDACVSVDRRGVSENWNIVPCDAKRMATCEVKISSQNASALCPSSSVFDPRATEYEPFNKVDCDTSSSPSCPPEKDEALKTAMPFCPENSETPRNEFDRLCCGGKSDTGPKEECKDGGVSVALIAGGIVGSMVLIAVLVLLIFLLRRTRQKRKASSVHLTTSETGTAHEAVTQSHPTTHFELANDDHTFGPNSGESPVGEEYLGKLNMT